MSVEKRMRKEDSSQFWRSFGYLKSVAELFAALVVIAPIVLASRGFVQHGLRAVVPAWVVFFPCLVAVVLGALLWKRLPTPNRGRVDGALLERIGFDYSDSPANHGWKIEVEKDGLQPKFRRFLDGHIGSAIEIRSTLRSRMERAISPAAILGTAIEFVVQLEAQYRIFTLVRVQTQDSAKSTDLWLGYQVGTEAPKRVDDGTWFEYRVSVTPQRLAGNWLKIRVDLVDAVGRTAGSEGWIFGHLKLVRFRGDLSVAHVSVFE